MAFRRRILIEGVLETRSPLHLGSGEVVHREGLVVEGKPGTSSRPAEVSAVAVDHLGRAYLPGRAVAGALRSWLTRVAGLGSEPALEQVFGTELLLPIEARPAGSNPVGGKAEVWNAFRLNEAATSAAPGDPARLPFWDPARGTAVRASVALDRRTRTVAEDRLFFEEVVPRGQRFLARVSGQDLSEEELDLLLFGLDGFNDPAHPVSLGAGGIDGHGRFTWTPRTLRALDAGQVKGWLALPAKPAGFNELPALPPDAQAQTIARALARWPRPSPAELTLGLELAFEAPFLVAAPTRKREEERGSGEPDHVPVMDLEGRPLLPASSLRGALRAQAEKILRTVGLHACRPESRDAACDPVHALGDVPKLCPACRLFGAPGWGGLLTVPDFEQVAEASAYERTFEHVAIDRLTGSVSGSLKFNSRAFVGARLAGTLRLDLGRTMRGGEGKPAPAVDGWMVGLLALVLRDLAEGDVPLGYGAAKGYGACTATFRGFTAVGWPGEPQSQEAALRDSVAAFHAKARTEGKAPLPYKPAPLPSAAAPAPPAPQGGAADDGRFHNPYHFVPLEPAMQDAEALSVADFQEGQLGAARHDRHLEGERLYSGRLVYRLTTRTPTVLGGEREKPGEGQTGAATVKSFELDGEPAIAGASLRGLLSSVIEAATGSALRVLNDASLSYRAGMRESLPALGRLVEGAEGKLELEPLALPHFDCDKKGNLLPRAADEAARWQELLPIPTLKVYVNGYRGLRKDGVELRPGSFLARRRPRSASSEHPNELWYMPLGSLPSWSEGELVVPNPHVTTTTNKGGKEFHSLVAQDPPTALPAAVSRDPISAAELERITDPALRALYVPGLLRVLDIEGHEKEIPAGRKHEIFLPLPSASRPRLAAQKAVDAFHVLADERSHATREEGHYLPFSLKGKTKEEGQLRLQAGDLVFFRLGEDGHVDRLAVSSIWRKSAGTVFGFVPERLRPFHPGRTSISPAERLFGFVEQGLQEAGAQRPAHALAGRVRVSFGRLEGQPPQPWYEVETPQRLRILGTPKPPAPALYFRAKDRGNGAIRKRDLTTTRHELQGRKVYLHAQKLEPAWQQPAGDEKRDHLRALVQPLRAGLPFRAHLDFDNLTERELALLLYALRPTAAFRHRLGMGKPLGLGTVEIEPLELLLVDRRRRYLEETDLLSAPRYQAEPGPDLEDLVARLRAALPTEPRHALELLGDPAAVRHRVMYPKTDEQGPDAEEGFQWFMQNEANGVAPEQLARIRPTDQELPSLPRKHQNASGGTHPSGRGAGPGRDEGQPARPTRPGSTGHQPRPTPTSGRPDSQTAAPFRRSNEAKLRAALENPVDRKK